MKKLLIATLLSSCQSGAPAASADANATDAALVSDAAFVDMAPRIVSILKNARIGSDASQPNFQHAASSLRFDGPFTSGHLIVDLATTCYPFSNWKTDPPPQGQNWPADCDAFDRNFELTLDPPAQMSDPPGIELIHAITPFGGPEHLEVDITDVANGLPGAHQLDVRIPTYSDASGKVTGSAGGWFVSVSLLLVPGPAPRQVLAVTSIFNGVQTMLQSPPPIPFSTPSGATSARLEIRASGHGGGAPGPGCIGPAEEFCHRQLAVLVDGQALSSVDPWRTDCDTLCTIMHNGSSSGGFDYCQENPCGAIQSVRAPRANWCPGSMTPPFTWPTPSAAGNHTLSWTFDRFLSGSWRLSATYFAFGG